jgi:hypothetical protein
MVIIHVVRSVLFAWMVIFSVRLNAMQEESRGLDRSSSVRSSCTTWFFRAASIASLAWASYQRVTYKRISIPAKYTACCSIVGWLGNELCMRWSAIDNSSLSAQQPTKTDEESLEDLSCADGRIVRVKKPQTPDELAIRQSYTDTISLLAYLNQADSLHSRK